MPSEKESGYLREMLDNIALAEQFAGSLSYGSLREDLRTLYAVIRSLEIISEASRRLSDELKARQFAAPEFSAESIKGFEKPWLVEVHVDVGEDGRPENVFLETGCDDKKVNAAVVKMVSMGKLKQPGTKCSGHVVMSFGKR